MKKIKAILADDGGGSEIVTLTICIVPLVFVFAMIISYGQAMYGAQVAVNAAGAGARAAAIQGNASMAVAMANELATDYIKEAGMGITFVSDELNYSSWERKKKLSYSVTVDVKTAMPMNVFGGISPNFRITKTCPAVIEKE